MADWASSKRFAMFFHDDFSALIRFFVRPVLLLTGFGIFSDALKN